jgi:hypothetical protein
MNSRVFSLAADGPGAGVVAAAATLVLMPHFKKSVICFLTAVPEGRVP